MNRPSLNSTKPKQENFTSNNFTNQNRETCLTFITKDKIFHSKIILAKEIIYLFDSLFFLSNKNHQNFAWIHSVSSKLHHGIPLADKNPWEIDKYKVMLHENIRYLI